MDGKKKSSSNSATSDSSCSFYRAITDYRDESPGMMPLEKGDIVEVVRKENQGLWLVKSHGKTGWTTSSCLEQVETSMLNLLNASLKGVKMDPTTLDAFQQAFEKVMSSDGDDVSVEFSVPEEVQPSSPSAPESSSKENASKANKGAKFNPFSISAESIIPFLWSFSAAAVKLSSSSKSSGSASAPAPAPASTKTKTKQNASTTSSSISKGTEAVRLLERMSYRMRCLDGESKRVAAVGSRLGKIKDSLEAERKYLIELRKSCGSSEKKKVLDLDNALAKRLQPLSQDLESIIEGLGDSQPGLPLLMNMGEQLFPNTSASVSKEIESEKTLLSWSIQILDRLLHTPKQTNLSENVPSELLDASKKDEASPVTEHDRLAPVTKGKTDNPFNSESFPSNFTAKAAPSAPAPPRPVPTQAQIVTKENQVTQMPLSDSSAAEEVSPVIEESNSGASGDASHLKLNELGLDMVLLCDEVSPDLSHPTQDSTSRSTSHSCILKAMSDTFESYEGVAGSKSLEIIFNDMSARKRALPASSQVKAVELAASILAPKFPEVLECKVFQAIIDLTHQIKDGGRQFKLKLSIEELLKACPICLSSVDLISTAYLAALDLTWSSKLQSQILSVMENFLDLLGLGGSEDPRRLLRESSNPSMTKLQPQPQATIYPIASNQLHRLSIVAWLNFDARSEGQGSFKRGQVATIVPFEIDSRATFDPYQPSQIRQDGWIRVVLGPENSSEVTVPLDMKDGNGQISSWQSKTVLVPAQYFLSEVRAKCWLRTKLLKSVSTSKTKVSDQIKALSMPSSKITDFASSHGCSVVTAGWISSKVVHRVGSRRNESIPAPVSAPGTAGQQLSSAESPSSSQAVSSTSTSVATTSGNSALQPTADATSDHSQPQQAPAVEKKTEPVVKAKPPKAKGHFKKTARNTARKESRMKEKNEKRESMMRIKSDEGWLTEKADLVAAASLVSLFNGRKNVKELLSWLQQVKKASIWKAELENCDLILKLIDSAQSGEISPFEMLEKIKSLINPALRKELLEEVYSFLDLAYESAFGDSLAPASSASPSKETNEEEAAKEISELSESVRLWASTTPSLSKAGEPEATLEVSPLSISAPKEVSPSPTCLHVSAGGASPEAAAGSEAETDQPAIDQSSRLSPKTKSQRQEKWKALRQAGLLVPSQLEAEFEELSTASMTLLRSASARTFNFSESMSRSASGVSHPTPETSLNSLQDSGSDDSSDSDSLLASNFESKLFEQHCKELDADSSSALVLVKFYVNKPGSEWAEEMQRQVTLSVNWPPKSRSAGWDFISDVIPIGWKSMWGLELQQVLLLDCYPADTDQIVAALRHELLRKIKHHNSVLDVMAQPFKNVEVAKATIEEIYPSILRLSETLNQMGRSLVATEFQDNRQRLRSIFRLQFGLGILRSLVIRSSNISAEMWRRYEEIQAARRSIRSSAPSPAFKFALDPRQGNTKTEPKSISTQDAISTYIPRSSSISGSVPASVAGSAAASETEVEKGLEGCNKDEDASTTNPGDGPSTGSESTWTTSNAGSTSCSKPVAVNLQIHSRPRQKGLHKKSSGKCRKTLLLD